MLSHDALVASEGAPEVHSCQAELHTDTLSHLVISLALSCLETAKKETKKNLETDKYKDNLFSVYDAPNNIYLKKKNQLGANLFQYRWTKSFTPSSMCWLSA